MLICVPDVLTADELASCRRLLSEAAWEDGRATAGAQSALTKRNDQLPPDSPQAREAGETILRALGQNETFISAALPKIILPPLFNRHGPGQAFGIHIDNAIRAIPGTGQRIRTDLSITLFLSEPDEYDGGELVVESAHGAQEVRLPAGHMVVYPATSPHQVLPVTRGARLASFFWLQSMIRDEAARTLLFDLDQTIQSLSSSIDLDDPALIRLTGIYHNFIRLWAEP